MPEPWLSVDDVAAHLRISKDSACTWITERAMPARKVGRLWKFQARGIDVWVRAGALAGDDELSPATGSVGGQPYHDGNEMDEEGLGWR